MVFRKGGPFHHITGWLPQLCIVFVCSVAPLCASDTLAKTPEFMKSLSTQSGANENPQVEFVIETEKRCMFGDMDLINLELQHATEPLVMQLSLELFDKSKSPIVAKKLEGKPGEVLGKYTFDLSSIRTPALAGIFICSYPQGDSLEACGSFPQKSFDSMFSPYQMNMEQVVEEAKVKGSIEGAPFHLDPDRKNNGHVYFFRFVILTKDGIHFPTKAMNAQRYNEFFQLANSYGIDSQSVQDAIVQRSRALGSLPLGMYNSTMSIVLPYYAPAKCRQ